MTNHVALVSAYPTETAAREGLTELYPELATYRGIWRTPPPYGATVHLFSDEPTHTLTAQGMTPEDTHGT